MWTWLWTSFKIPLFQCKWVNLAGGVEMDRRYGMTTVDLNNLGYHTEPFVLANDVAQVFYDKDMSSRPKKRKDKRADTSCDQPKRHIVLSGKSNKPFYQICWINEMKSRMHLFDAEAGASAFQKKKIIAVQLLWIPPPTRRQFGGWLGHYVSLWANH